MFIWLSQIWEKSQGWDGRAANRSEKSVRTQVWAHTPQQQPRLCQLSHEAVQGRGGTGRDTSFCVSYSEAGLKGWHICNCSHSTPQRSSFSVPVDLGRSRIPLRPFGSCHRENEHRARLLKHSARQALSALPPRNLSAVDFSWALYS